MVRTHEYGTYLYIITNLYILYIYSLQLYKYIVSKNMIKTLKIRTKFHSMYKFSHTGLFVKLSNTYKVFNINVLIVLLSPFTNNILQIFRHVFKIIRSNDINICFYVFDYYLKIFTFFYFTLVEVYNVNYLLNKISWKKIKSSKYVIRT